MGDRCKGHCCRSLFVPLSPSAMRENARMARDRNWDRKWRDRNGNRMINDISIIADMLRPNGQRHQGWTSHLPARYGYECRHLSVDGDCRIHETKPKMCRSYPNGAPCERHDCQWDAAREGRAQ